MGSYFWNKKFWAVSNPTLHNQTILLRISHLDTLQRHKQPLIGSETPQRMRRLMISTVVELKDVRFHGLVRLHLSPI